MSQVTKEINVSEIVKKVELTVLRKVSTTDKGHMYHVRSTKTGGDYYLLIKGGEDPEFKPHHDYEVAVAGSKGNKQIWATIPVEYTALNDNLATKEYEGEVMTGTELQTVEQRSLYRGRAELPSIAEIDEQIKRYEYVKKKLIKPEDQQIISGKKYTKKSGWRKFINAFGLSIELINKNVFEEDDDKHAEVRVRAIAPNGQSVEGIGIKSMSNVFGAKTLHNLVATAWTKAVNRAVSDLVAFGAVSAEEIQEGSD